MLPVVTGEFRAAADPDLRFAPSGTAVGKIRAVASSRKKNDAGEWADDKTCWVTIVGFNKVAENMAESFEKGDLMVVVGKINTDDWEDNDGNKRTSIQIVADFIGPAITFNAARSMRSERPSGGGSQQRPSGGGASRSTTVDENDPWATPAGQNDEPPF